MEPFDSSVSRGKHCLLIVGDGENGLSGLLIGLITMRKNEVAQFLISPKYAYGELGCPPRIPPNSSSFFINLNNKILILVLIEVEMFDFIDRKAMVQYRKTIELVFYYFVTKS